MPAQRLAIRPQRGVCRLKDRPFVQSEQVTGNVAMQPFIKGPVTETAEGQAVARVVIVTDRPGNSVEQLLL